MKKIFTILSAAFLLGQIFAQTVNDFRDSTSSGVLRRAISSSTYPSGSIFLLNNSKTYDMINGSNPTISKSFVVTGDISTSGKPTITIDSTRSFTIATGGSIDSIKFVDVNIVGIKSKRGLDAAGGYLFNNGSNVVTLNKLIISNCNVSRLRGFFRIRTAGSTLTSAYINNCIFDSVGGYNIVTAEDAKISSIYIGNSTFVKSERLIRSTTANSDNVTVENCTFLQAPTSKNQLILYGTGTITGTKTLSNCIFGPVWHLSSVVDTATIISPSATLGFTISNCYRTREINILDSATSAITRYEKSCNEVFTDTSSITISSINLKIKDQAFPGKFNCGDPRWYSGATTIIASSKNNSNLIVRNNELAFNDIVKKVEIYSINGRLIKSAKNVNQLSTSYLPKGIYIVRITDKYDILSTQKFIK